jgi:hypothetical protein
VEEAMARCARLKRRLWPVQRINGESFGRDWVFPKFARGLSALFYAAMAWVGDCWRACVHHRHGPADNRRVNLNSLSDLAAPGINPLPDRAAVREPDVLVLAGDIDSLPETARS